MASAFNFMLVSWKRVELAPVAAAIGDGAAAIPREAYVVSGVFPLPLGPEQIEYQALMASQLRFTSEGVDIQRNEQRAWSIRISGSSGLRERTAFDRYGIPMRAAGPVLHRELVGFLQEFSRDPTGRLSWHDFVKQRQLWAEPAVMTDGRDSQHTLDDSWTIQLQGYGESGYPTGGLAFVLSLGAKLREILGIADRWLSVVAASADLAAVAMAEIAAAEAGVLELFDVVPDVVEATAGLVAGTAEIKDYPVQWWKSASERMGAALASFDRAIDRWEASGSEHLESGVAFRAAVRELQTQCAVAALAQSKLVTAAETPATYKVKPGDTLQGIAAKVLGSAAKWTGIANLNGLMPPYVSTSGMPGTVGPGDTLLLPVAAVDVQQSADVYGRDFLLSTDREGRLTGGLVPEPGDHPADFQYVSGVRCALQGLNVLVNTRQGGDPFRQWFGVPAAIGDRLTDAGIVLSSLVDQVLADDRFVRVLNPTNTRIANGVRVSFDAVLRSAQTVPLTAVVGGGA